MRSAARETRRKRRAQERLQRKIAEQAQRRGRAVPPTVEGFRQAITSGGYDAMAEALIARQRRAPP
jgi:hypothetical protein